ncbi:uncharacterized protein [Montipora foliosa]|uniref:uncharacterized protein n=1 Tax=Montipora foliosa TaxID=591990 RepID=UPI0035F15720
MSEAVAKLGGWIDEGPEQETICSTDMSAAEIFNSYHDEVVAHQSSTQFISVTRMQISLLMQLMHIYKDPRLDLTKPLNVNFVGEHGADVGGPTKEYFHEAISILSKVDTPYNIQPFGGQDGHLLPLYGVDAISSGCFETAGKLVAHSVLHGGPGMAGLSPVVIKYLVTGSIDEAKELVSIDDLYDPELQEILQTKFKEETKIKNIDSNLKGKLEDILVKHGLKDVVPLTDVNKAKAIKDLLIAEVLITRTLALDSFFKGLNVHGLGDLFRKHPGVVSYVLPTKEEASVGVELFKGKLVFCDEDLNDEEVQTRMWLLQFIEETSRMREESEQKGTRPQSTKFVIVVYYWYNNNGLRSKGGCCFPEQSHKTIPGGR